jgi:RNA-directed DNA polymerase
MVSEFGAFVDVEADADANDSADGGRGGFDAFISFDNLLAAYTAAARGKHGSGAVARFAFKPGDHVLALQRALAAGTWRPGAYVQFAIHESKRRWISAAPFADRVVHHALMQVVQPRFERNFSPHSFANRVGLGTHRAVNRLQGLAQQHRCVLRLDVQRHFPSIDHMVLLDLLDRRTPEPGLQRVVRLILVSGEGVADPEQADPGWLYPGDDLLALTRPRGLPVGNLTSQHWSNVYMHPLDEFCQRTLGCSAYVRYVDDFALFHDDKYVLADWRAQIIAFLARRLRLRIHENAAHVQACSAGIPWLGFVVYPGHRRVKARKVVEGTRRLQHMYDSWCAGAVSFAEFDACVQGWINHVRHADTLGLRAHVLGRFELGGRDISKK